LRPAECDQVATALLCQQRNELLASPHTRLELHGAESGRALAREELAAPRGVLVLRLVGERRDRIFLEDVQRDDVDPGISGEFE